DQVGPMDTFELLISPVVPVWIALDALVRFDEEARFGEIHRTDPERRRKDEEWCYHERLIEDRERLPQVGFEGDSDFVPGTRHKWIDLGIDGGGYVTVLGAGNLGGDGRAIQ